MAEIASAVSWLFAAVSLGAVAFFTHKVLWLVRYKKLQRQLMDEAKATMLASQRTALPAWEEFAAAAWRVARGPLHRAELDSPAAYARAVEEELGATVSRLPRRQRLAPLLASVVTRKRPGLLEEVVLEAPLRDGTVATARIHLDPPLVCEATPPPARAYELNVKSRYSFWRRALVFVTGLADVVYSSHHIAKMSQYAHVSTSTILRRMSLVILLVVGILLEVVVGLRAALERVIDRHVVPGASWVRELPEVLRDNFASLAALALWTVAVGALYFGLYFRIRRRSKLNLRALGQLKSEEQSRLRAIGEQHLASLLQWAKAYGQSLDSAAELTARHIEMLGNHYAARVRRQLAGPLLHEVGHAVSDALFARLPEASTTLQTTVTTAPHSFAHDLWPRRDEMTDVIEQALYREAWQHLELSLGELSRGEPDPEQIAALWRTLVSCVARFGDALPADMKTRLRSAYVKLVEDTSAATEQDLARFQNTARELVSHLDDQLASASPLLAARIELANQRIRADSADFTAEVVRAREAARLEALAFEI